MSVTYQMQFQKQTMLIFHLEYLILSHTVPIETYRIQRATVLIFQGCTDHNFMVSHKIDSHLILIDIIPPLHQVKMSYRVP